MNVSAEWPVNLAVAGDLDELVLRRLLAAEGGSVGLVYGKQGKSHILARVKAWNLAARIRPWIVLVDHDRDPMCPPKLLARYLPDPSSGMCFRISVEAVESWLIADRERFEERTFSRHGETPPRF